MKTSQDQTIQQMVEALGQKKYSFLSSLESDIKSYIARQSPSQCMTLVSRCSDGSVMNRWYPKEILDGYAERLYAFLKKKPCNGYTIDSALTDEVVDIVTKRYQTFYKDNASVLTKPVLEHLMSNKTFSEQLAKQIIESTNSPIPAYVRSQMVQAVVHYLEDSVQTNIIQHSAQSIQHITAGIIGVATAIPISKTVATALMSHMAVFLKGAVAKVLASSAVKTMLVGAVKKLVIAKIFAFFAGLLAPVLGSAAIWWLIVPALAAFIAYEIKNLPQKMSEKISVAVKNELSGEFDKINEQIASNILSGLSTSALITLCNDIAADIDVNELLNAIKK